ncbi:MAG: FAD-dependent oxidoreductase [Dehalococcoidia bacterium]
MEPSTGPKKIIVVGGGIAGLTAAYRLQQRGFDAEVLEREDTAGGRMRSERHGDFVVDRGAQFIASSYHNMRALVDELGLKPSVRRLKTGRGATLRDGKFVSGNYAGLRAMLRARDLGWPSRLRLPRILMELRRYVTCSTSTTSSAPPRSTMSPRATGRSAASAARCWTT